MKARFFTAIMLMISLAAFAQPSRRDDSERRGRPNSNRGNANNQNERRENNTQRQNNFDNRNHNDNYNRSDNHRDNRHDEVTSSKQRMPERGRNHEAFEHNAYHEREFGGRPDYHVYHSFRRPVLASYDRRHIEPMEVRRARFPYRTPVRAEIIWTASMYHDYRFFYPEVHIWRYPIGHRIISVAAYDARDYAGEVTNIYGRVIETYYNEETDEYYLYFGDRFPYQDFSVVVPGNEARRFSDTPERYFENEHIAVTGYVNNFEGKPEIQVRRASQIKIY